ncbi:threonine aldolase family protein [Halocatena marina]|uniref:threonine aldolase family protein n=1 Tax=Halocatena marina TaxID=2934937 RepID=UPI00200FD143|nr:low specificity L-threonine aldolase [Halocatena marina]
MIDLRSDTVTRPNDAMRESARDAEVGDDVYHEDPTVNELERRVADRLGFEDALFVPSGTMGNQVAARTHTDRGQEILLERDSHIYRWECAGLAQHASLQTRPIDGGKRGVITSGAVREGHVRANDHRPGTGLLALENTHNAKGGTAISPKTIDAAAKTAHDLGVPVHLDGARLANAAVAHDVALSRMTREVDSVMMCLSKGLGAPIGSMLAGSSAFIDRARRGRKLLGGGMRQAGIIAAPGMLALENVERLETDHENARLLAQSLDALQGLTAHEPETNIVLVETHSKASDFLTRCADAGVGGVEFDDHLVRFTTHWDIDRADIETAIERITKVIEKS